MSGIHVLGWLAVLSGQERLTALGLDARKATHRCGWPSSCRGGGVMYGYGVLGLIVTILVIVLLLRLLGVV